MLLTKSTISTDFDVILEIINDASIAYKGIIPDDRWTEPYMSKEALQIQLDEGVEFWKYTKDQEVLGVMGLQFKNEVTLIRHAYVRTTARNMGIGGALLGHLTTLTDKPILIGTWADATWAISFYKKHGFSVLPKAVKTKLLRTYWSIPARQEEASIVLANDRFQHV